MSLGSCVPNLGNLRPLEVKKKSGELNNRKNEKKNEKNREIHFWPKTGHFQRAIKSKVFRISTFRKNEMEEGTVEIRYNQNWKRWG